MKVPRSPAGFVAGTLVHTPGGPKPIGQVAAGDLVVAKASGGQGVLTQKRVTRAFSAAEQEVFFLSHDVLEGKTYRSGILAGSDGLRPWVGREVDGYPEEEVARHDEPISMRALHEAKFERINGDRPPMDFEIEMRDGRIGKLGFCGVIIVTSVADVGIDFDGSPYWYSDGAWGVAIHLTPDGPRVDRSPNGGYQDMYIGLDPEDYEHLDPESTMYRTAGFAPMLRTVHCIEIEDGFGYYAGEDGMLVFGGSTKDD